MQKITPLQQGQYYHIYNCGINGESLFKEEINYTHFLKLFDKYIAPVANTFAWCLMGNHFHLLVRVKEDIEYKYSNADRSFDPVRFEEVKWETADLSSSKGHDSVKIPNATNIFHSCLTPMQSILIQNINDMAAFSNALLDVNKLRATFT